MKNKLADTKNIVLLDFQSEKNRGDGIMQQSIINLAQKYFPDHSLTVVASLGVNQFPAADGDFFCSQSEGVASIVGGLFNTYHQLDDQHFTPLQRKFLNLWALCKGGLLLFFLALRIPSGLIRATLHSKAQHTFSIIKKSDFVIWKSRNIRGAGYIKEFYDVLVLFFNPLVCLLLRKRLVCVGVSVWELHNPLTRMLVKYVFSRCELVTVRENHSYKILVRILGNKHNHIIQLPDLALYRLRDIPRIAHKKHVTPQRIGITLAGEREIGSAAYLGNYVAALQVLVRKLLSENLNLEVKIIPQVTFGPEQTDVFAHEVFAEWLTDPRLCILNQEYTTDQLIELYASLDVLIASRMHSGIFSLVAGTPIIAIAYDYGSKWDILSGDLGLPEEFIVDMNEIRPESLINIFDSVWSKRAEVVEHVQERFSLASKDVERHVSLIRELYDKRIPKK